MTHTCRWVLTRDSTYANKLQPFLQPGLLYNSTLKSWAEFLVLVSAVYAWLLPETVMTVHVKCVLPVSSLQLIIRSSTNQRYVVTCASTSVVSALGRHCCTLAIVLHQPSSQAYVCTLLCGHLKFIVYGKHVQTHMCNAVLLGLAPTIATLQQ